MPYLPTDTVDDSATVRLITMVTLIFLPASFVTVSHQMRPITSPIDADTSSPVFPRHESFYLPEPRWLRICYLQTILDLRSFDGVSNPRYSWILDDHVAGEAEAEDP